MFKAVVKIVGVKPFLFHKFNIESLTETRKPKEGSVGNNPYEWRNGFFLRGDDLYMPSSYVMASLKNGSVNTKAGRGTIQKTWISAVNVEEDIVIFNRKIFKDWDTMEPDQFPKEPTDPVYIDIRMVSNPNTKGKNVRYRLAMSKGWACEFTLLVDDSLVSQAQVRKVVEDTGKLQGIADGRTLGYGRYNVESIEFFKE